MLVWTWIFTSRYGNSNMSCCCVWCAFILCYRVRLLVYYLFSFFFTVHYKTDYLVFMYLDKKHWFWNLCPAGSSWLFLAKLLFLLNARNCCLLSWPAFSLVYRISDHTSWCSVFWSCGCFMSAFKSEWRHIFMCVFLFSAEVDKTHAVSALSAVIRYLEVSRSEEFKTFKICHCWCLFSVVENFDSLFCHCWCVFF